MVKAKHIIIFIFTVFVSVFLSLNVKKWYNNSFYPEITFNVKKIDMDTIYKESQAIVYFRYKNTGNKNLKIFRIETSCGCTIPTFNDSFLAPQKGGKFKIKYETINKGYFEKEIMVYSNSRTSPDRLIIKGYVPFNYKNK